MPLEKELGKDIRVGEKKPDGSWHKPCIALENAGIMLCLLAQGNLDLIRIPLVRDPDV